MKIAPLNYANARKAGEEEKGEVDIVEGGGEGGRISICEFPYFERTRGKSRVFSSRLY